MKYLLKIFKSGDANRKSRFHTQNAKLIPLHEMIQIPAELIFRFLGIDRSGPWLPKRAVRELKKILGSHQKIRVLEIGGGNSSLFFATRSAHLTTIEDNKEWADSLNSKLPKLTKNYQVINMQISQFLESKYYEKIDFNLVLIDSGTPIERKKALVEISRTNPKAMIILDNSDWQEFQNIQELIPKNRVEKYLGLMRKPFQVNETSFFYFK